MSGLTWNRRCGGGGGGVQHDEGSVLVVSDYKLHACKHTVNHAMYTAAVHFILDLYCLFDIWQQHASTSNHQSFQPNSQMPQSTRKGVASHENPIRRHRQV